MTKRNSSSSGIAIAVVGVIVAIAIMFCISGAIGSFAVAWVQWVDFNEHAASISPMIAGLVFLVAGFWIFTIVCLFIMSEQLQEIAEVLDDKDDEDGDDAGHAACSS